MGISWSTHLRLSSGREGQSRFDPARDIFDLEAPIVEQRHLLDKAEAEPGADAETSEAATSGTEASIPEPDLPVESPANTEEKPTL